MCIFSNFSDIFGAPNTGLHSLRLFDTAMVDYLLSILFSMYITQYNKIPMVINTIVVLLIGVLMHYIFGVNTNTLKYLGITCN